MTDQSTENKDKFFKKPNEIIQKMGGLTSIINLKVVENLPATCVAMDNVAEAKKRDDMAKQNGSDDYTLSLQKLFDAFDTFIGEYSGGKHIVGWEANYDFSDPCDLTIFLLWQIRNIRVHHGGLIDEKCKKKYEVTLKTALEKGVKPIINLPKQVEIGHEFTVNLNNYSLIEKCIFTYIGKRVSGKDIEILSIRAFVTDLKLTTCEVLIESMLGPLKIDLAEAYDCGCKIDLKTKKFSYPSKAIYDHQTERIILVSSGESFSAKKVK